MSDPTRADAEFQTWLILDSGIFAGREDWYYFQVWPLLFQPNNRVWSAVLQDVMSVFAKEADDD